VRNAYTEGRFKDGADQEEDGDFTEENMYIVREKVWRMKGETSVPFLGWQERWCAFIYGIFLTIQIW